MNDHELSQIAETVDAIVARAASALRAEEAILPLLLEAGLRRVAVPVSAGGSEGEHAYLGVVLKRLGYHAVDTSVLEDHLAAEMLASHADHVPEGMLTLTARSELRLSESDGKTVVSGICRQVPSARSSSHIVATATSNEREVLVALAVADAELTQRQNLAGEPRDDLRFDLCEPLAVMSGAEVTREFKARLLCYRSFTMLGAGEHALDLTITHVTDRTQFGSALSRKQVVQHYVAEMFGALAAARSACDAAMLSLESGACPAVLAASLATRIEAHRMASTVARLAHQLHGAIGFTEEHILHQSTKRLTAWRQDDLAERACAVELACMVSGLGGPWDLMTAAGGAKAPA